MKKESNRIILIEIILFLIAISFFLLIDSFNIITLSLILLIPLISSYFLLGKLKRKETRSVDILLIIISYTLLYYLITYALGYYSGFVKSSYNHNIIPLITNIGGSLCFIVIVEYIRSFITRSCYYNNKVYLVLLVIIMSFVDSITYSTLSNINDKRDIVLLLTNILPIISKNILLTYVVYYSSVINTITYRVIMEIPIYLLPIFPSFGSYVKLIILFIFPLLVLYSVRNRLYRRVNNKKISKISIITTIVLFIVLLLIVILSSGIIRFYALAIGSESMKPTINKGDVVIIDKKKDYYEVNDIIAFKHDGKIIIHRIVEVDNYYKTKGDYNTNQDNWNVDKKDIVGLVKFKIRYLGYPTVYLNEWIMDGD